MRRGGGGVAAKHYSIGCLATYAVVLCIGYLPSTRLALIFHLVNMNIYYAYLLGLLWYLLWSSSKASHILLQGQHKTCAKTPIYIALVKFSLKSRRNFELAVAYNPLLACWNFFEGNRGPPGDGL